MGRRYRDIVRQHSRAKRSARAVIMLLSDYADDDGLAWPGHARIAAECGLSERTVTRAISELIEAGELAVEEAACHHKSPTYRIVLAPAQTAQGRQPDYSQGRQFDNQGRHPDRQGRQIVIDRVDKLSRAYIEEPQLEPQEPESEPRVGAATSQPQPSPAPTPQVIRSGIPGAKAVRVDSPHLKGAPFSAEGYIPPGAGSNAVQVYYERFPLTQNDARLRAPQEDDLIRLCPDLERLRQVVTAYSNSPHRVGNVQLILDWYNRGIPNHPGGNHATHRSGSFGRAAFPSLAAQSPGQPEPEYDPFAGLTPDEVERIRLQVSRARGYGVPAPA